MMLGTSGTGLCIIGLHLDESHSAVTVQHFPTDISCSSMHPDTWAGDTRIVSPAQLS